MLSTACSEEDTQWLILRVKSIPESTPQGDSIFLAGSFNDWDPAHPDYLLTDNGQGQLEVRFDPAPGDLEYKFTRGTWEEVEGGTSGQDIGNRTLTYQGGGGILEVDIISWRDLDGPVSTRAENVSILSLDFEMPQLDRERRIWIYLPPDYASSERSYPVLYMHDGQNLFDDLTSFVGEWGIDESLNTLFDNGDRGLIVVGVDNHSTYRLDEYSPWVNPEYGGGQGDEYVAFLVETLKPYVDANYRTLPDRDHTGIMGSSMGGLISLYGAVEYQDVFGRAGVFSPSFWFSPDCYSHVTETGRQEEVKIYMIGGELEGDYFVQSMNAMMDTLKAAGFEEENLFMEIHPLGDHTERYWREEFPDAYTWLYSEGP